MKAVDKFKDLGSLVEAYDRMIGKVCCIASRSFMILQSMYWT